MRRVLVEGWQMQCSDDPFAVGSEISWTVGRLADPAFLGDAIGSDQAATVTDVEDHHDVEQVDDEPLVGTVRSITAMFCSYAPSTPSAKALYPVAGTAVLEPRDRVDGWEREVPHSRVFVGYLVDVEDDA